MGFIENLRRQAKDREVQRVKEEQGRVIKYNQRRKKEKAEHEKFLQLVSLSKMHLEKSAFPQLCSDLTSLGKASTYWKVGTTDDDQLKTVRPRKDSMCLELWLTERTFTGATKYIVIESRPEGTIVVHGGLFGSTTLPLSEWQDNPEIQEKALERAYKHPRLNTADINKWGGGPGAPGPCLPGNSFINTPNGDVLIRDLRIGDYVWTVDRYGKKVRTVIVKKTKRVVSKSHKVAHIILKDGRELVVSPGHPTIDYREIGSLAKGDDLDMSTVASIKVIPYKGKYTYDILPCGDMGGYWANNILIGSTLSSQFERTLLDGLYKPLYLSL